MEALLRVSRNRKIVFNDDNMFMNRKESYELLKAIIPLSIKYFVEADVSIAEDARLLDLMAKSGCVTVFIGFESLVSDNLDAIQRTKWKRRRGAVIGLSGGIDSTLVAALCVRALGKNRVLGILMPEEESAAETVPLGRLAAESLAIPVIIEDITPILRGARCYERRDEAIRACVPEYSMVYRSENRPSERNQGRPFWTYAFTRMIEG